MAEREIKPSGQKPVNGGHSKAPICPQRGGTLGIGQAMPESGSKRPSAEASAPPAGRRTLRGKRPQRRRPKAEKRRGLALQMVLVITAVLSALAADLSNESQVNLRASVNARDELQAHFHARSALELEFFVLRFQSLVRDSIGRFLPVPLFELSGMLVSSDTVKGIIDEDGDPEDALILREDRSFASDIPIGDFEGSFWIEEVVDENRKINLNATDLGVGCNNLLHLVLGAVFDDPGYDPLFEELGESRDPVRNRIDLIANITDWTDGNQTVDPVCILTQQQIGAAAEDARYSNLAFEADYQPKDGMFDSLAELRLVPHVNDAFMQVFSKYFTVWGDNGGIAMQTADPWMLTAVVRAVMSRPMQPSDTERFQAFLDEWTLISSVPGGRSLINEQVFVSAMNAAGIPHDPQRLQRLVQQEAIRFTDVSSVYRITAVGRVNDASSRITAVWRDNRATGELKYWRED